MVKYRRTAPDMLATPTSGGGTLGIPNYGVSIITSTAAGDWAMSAPLAGIMKTIIALPSTTGAARIVRLSTLSSGDSVSILMNTGDATVNEINFNSTGLMSISLVGLSSVQWKVLSATSGTGAYNTTGIVYQAS